MGKKMGRPHIEISDKLFDTLIQLPLIKADIAHALSISEDTVDRYCERRFGTTYAVQKDQNKAMFRGRLLGKQYELAMKGNTQLLIWLGKQHLDQADKQETKHAGVINTHVTAETPEQQLERIKKMVKEEV